MAKTGTYALIASNTLGSAQANVTFSSIPATFTDLVLVINGSVTTGNPAVWMRFNSDSTTNYSYTRVTGNGTAAASSNAVNAPQANIAPAFGMTTTFETNIIANILDYANTTTYKTILARANTPSLGTEATVNLWRKTPEVINTIVILPSTATTFTSGSTFYLYGIQAGSI